MKNTMDFNEWMNELERIAVAEFGFSEGLPWDRESWQGYFDRGCSPREALAEDVSNA